MIYLLTNRWALHQELVVLCGKGIRVSDQLGKLALPYPISRDQVRSIGPDLEGTFDRWLESARTTVDAGVRPGSHTVALAREIASPDCRNCRRLGILASEAARLEAESIYDQRELEDALTAIVAKTRAVIDRVIDLIQVVVQDIERLPPETELSHETDDFLVALSKQLAEALDGIADVAKRDRITAAQVDDIWTNLLVDGQLAAPELRYLEKWGPRGLALVASKIRKS